MVVALSLSRSLSELGALVAILCLLGIAVLALVFFVQGRELRDLQEWVRHLRAAPPPPQEARRPTGQPAVTVRNQPHQPVFVPTRTASPQSPAPVATKLPPAPVPRTNLQTDRLPDPSEFRFLKEEPSRRPLFVGVAVVAALALGVAGFLASGGTSANRSVAGGTSAPKRSASENTATNNDPPPAQLAVTVLNATEINGLAHRLAGQLQGDGYSRAQALNGKPPGTFTTTVVEYGKGFREAAQRLARVLALEGGAVKPLESGVASLAGGAPVVVVATAGSGEETAASQTNAEPPPSEEG